MSRRNPLRSGEYESMWRPNRRNPVAPGAYEAVWPSGTPIASTAPAAPPRKPGRPPAAAATGAAAPEATGKKPYTRLPKVEIVDVSLNQMTDAELAAKYKQLYAGKAGRPPTKREGLLQAIARAGGAPTATVVRGTPGRKPKDAPATPVVSAAAPVAAPTPSQPERQYAKIGRTEQIDSLVGPFTVDAERLAAGGRKVYFYDAAGNGYVYSAKNDTGYNSVLRKLAVAETSSGGRPSAADNAAIQGLEAELNDALPVEGTLVVVAEAPAPAPARRPTPPPLPPRPSRAPAPAPAPVVEVIPPQDADLSAFLSAFDAEDEDEAPAPAPAPVPVAASRLDALREAKAAKMAALFGIKRNRSARSGRGYRRNPVLPNNLRGPLIDILVNPGDKDEYRRSVKALKVTQSEAEGIVDSLADIIKDDPRDINAMVKDIKKKLIELIQIDREFQALEAQEQAAEVAAAMPPAPAPAPAPAAYTPPAGVAVPPEPLRTQLQEEIIREVVRLETGSLPDPNKAPAPGPGGKISPEQLQAQIRAKVGLKGNPRHRAARGNTGHGHGYGLGRFR